MHRFGLVERIKLLFVLATCALVATLVIGGARSSANARERCHSAPASVASSSCAQAAMTSASDAQARISTRLPLGASAIHGAQASSGAARNASDARLTVPRLATGGRPPAMLDA